MPTILDLPRHATIDGPQHPALAKLWALALAKFQAQHEEPPRTREAWRAVVRDYDQLRRKAGGSIAQVIEQRCAEAPGGD